MGSSSSIRNELSLDLNPTTMINNCYVPKPIREFIMEVCLMDDDSEKLLKFDQYIKCLEDERRKIDAFKRELPHCMFLLDDVINYLKEEVMKCGRKVEPVLEEFMPLKNNCEDENEIDKEKDSRDKKEWMSSCHLWKPADTKAQESKQGEREEARSTIEVKTYVPLKEYPVLSTPFRECSRKNKEDKEAVVVHELSILTPGTTKNSREKSGSSGLDSSCNRALSSAAPSFQSNLRTGPQPPHQQTSRKQRRCWSPDLHRRFVNALQQLGGSQVATPKQIRELMQVDGLTNDEVKSHLQKYRLHSKRVPGSQSGASTSQSVVALGGSWMNQTHYGESSKHSDSHSGSPQGPLHLFGSNGGTSTTGGDSMEDDDEDDKCESYSCKSHIHGPGRDNA